MHFLDPLWPVETIEVRDETICVLRDFEYPLTDRATLDTRPTSITGIIREDFFIRESSLTRWTVVDREVLLVGESSTEKLEKYPLSPLIVLWIGRIDHTIPVIGKPEIFHLLGKCGDIFSGRDRRMGSCLDRVVLSW